MRVAMLRVFVVPEAGASAVSAAAGEDVSAPAGAAASSARKHAANARHASTTASLVLLAITL